MGVFPEYNVRDFGAVGNGLADDTAAINACLNAALGGAAGAAPSPIRGSLGVVVIPAGTYKVTAPIVVTSAYGLTVRGAGRGRTKIAASGTLTNVIQFVGCPELVVQDLTITSVGGYTGGSSASGSALALDFTPALSAAWGARAVIERITVADLKCKYGIASGASSENFDLSDVSLRDCCVEGAWVLGSSDTAWYQAAFLSGSGVPANVLNHFYDNISATNFRALLRVASVNLVTAHAVTGSLIERVFDVVGWVNLHSIGGRIEDSRKLLTTSGDQPTLVTIESMEWSPNVAATLADRKIVEFIAAGALILRNCTFENDSTGTGWQIEASTSNLPERQIRVLVENCAAPNATAESLFSVPTGSKVRAEVRFLVHWLATTGLAGTYTTKRLLYNGATADAADATVTT